VEGIGGSLLRTGRPVVGKNRLPGLAAPSS
jgi:hypothetical protein